MREGLSVPQLRVYGARLGPPRPSDGRSSHWPSNPACGAIPGIAAAAVGVGVAALGARQLT